MAAHESKRQRSAVLVPVKSFDLAKKRLGASLTPRQRSGLARSMTRQVLTAAKPLPTFVVCGSAEVAAWAVGAGVDVIWHPKPGLNQAVTAGVRALTADGFDSVIIAHGDLPLARSLTWVADESGVTVVTDRRGEGTNVMAIPTRCGFVFHYGENSAHLHQVEAQRLGLRFRRLDDPELSWDIDTPADLASLPHPEDTAALALPLPADTSPAA